MALFLESPICALTGSPGGPRRPGSPWKEAGWTYQKDPDKTGGRSRGKLTLEPLGPDIPAVPGGPTGPCRDDGNLLKRDQIWKLDIISINTSQSFTFLLNCLLSEGAWFCL